MFVCVIVVTTRKVAVISGSAATFNCTINAPKYDVCWTHKNVLSRNHNDLYVKGELTPLCDHNRCNVIFDNEKNRYLLTIRSVQPYDAGFYFCRICDEFSYDQVAELIVLQTGQSSYLLHSN